MLAADADLEWLMIDSTVVCHTSMRQVTSPIEWSGQDVSATRRRAADMTRLDLSGYAATGDLALNGVLHPVAGVLPVAFGASAAALSLICPASQGDEAA